MLSALHSRWGQLILGIVCMVMIANLQYGWTLFVLPISHAHHWGIAEIQVAFTIFVIGETWLLPLAGYAIDRIGPRLTVVAGGVMIGAAWVLDGLAGSLTHLYFAAAVAGIGGGFIYGATVGNALKWFPDRRGLAAGLTAAGFGAGSAVTVIPISNMIAGSGYQATFVFFGLLQGIVVVLVGLLLRAPPGPDAGREAVLTPSGITAVRPSRLHDLTLDHTPGQVVRAPVFWVMYLMFVLVGAGGLMATAQLSVIATDFGVANTPVTLLFMTMPALTFALSLDRVTNGLTRPLFGWISDRIGRENTMFVAFLLEGAGIFALIAFATSPVAVRGAVGTGVLRLGRDLLVVPRHQRRHVRPPLRRHQLRHVVYRQGYGFPAGAAGQRVAGRDRQLACGAVRRRRGEPAGRVAGPVRAEADAPPLHPPLDGGARGTAHRSGQRADRPQPGTGRRVSLYSCAHRR